MGIFQITPTETDAPNLEESKEAPVVPTNVEEKQEGSTREQNIVLDGPLSNIYTKALNLVFAKEAVMTVAAVLNKKEQDEADDKLENSEDIYVYCIDADKMSQKELVESTNQLLVASESKKYKQVMLAIESHNSVSKKTVLLHDFARSIGLEVYFSQKATIGAVHTALESLNKR